ncbi:hypothetical protein FBU31_004651, partial [Coemansia sp. 'formosensis']
MDYEKKHRANFDRNSLEPYGYFETGDSNKDTKRNNEGINGFWNWIKNTDGCLRHQLAVYLDGKGVECLLDDKMANCDNCQKMDDMAN